MRRVERSQTYLFIKFYIIKFYFLRHFTIFPQGVDICPLFKVLGHPIGDCSLHVLDGCLYSLLFLYLNDPQEYYTLTVDFRRCYLRVLKYYQKTFT